MMKPTGIYQVVITKARLTEFTTAERAQAAADRLNVETEVRHWKNVTLFADDNKLWVHHKSTARYAEKQAFDSVKDALQFIESLDGKIGRQVDRYVEADANDHAMFKLREEMKDG